MVIVGADFGTGLETATRLRPPRVGQQLVVGVPDTGRSRSLIIAGVAQSARWAGADHVYAATVVGADLTGTASGNLLFVSIDGATNPDVVAAVVNGTHLVNGARAESFRSLAAARVATEQALLRLAEAAVALGLAAGAFAVLNTLSRAVADRGREIGVLRTMAMSRGAIHRTFAVEAVWLALLGAVGGAGCGILMGWLLGHSGAFAAGAAPIVAGPTLVTVVVVAIAASLLASWWPARRACRVDPAVAMRTNDG
jgi:putative ABC transport system permease protein